MSSFILTVMTAPSVTNPAIKQTKYIGDSTFYSLSPAGTPPFTFQWLHSGNIIQGATNAIYSGLNLTLQDSGTYTCKIHNICDSTLVNVAYLIVLPASNIRYSVSGFVKYDNASQTPMSSDKQTTETTVYLCNTEGVKLDSTMTDNLGGFNFKNNPNGSYLLTCKTSKSWGVATPVDALLVNRYYIGAYKISDPMKLLAADVNNDKKINPLDAIADNRSNILE